MKCLVTGGAGFIGSNIVDALLRRGDQVRILDNLTTGDKRNLAAVWKRISFIKGDLRNPRDLKKAVAGVDVIFHQAALRSVARSVEDPASSDMVNVHGTLQLLIEAKRAKVRRVVYASSSSVYGASRVYPQHEELRTNPLSPYAVSKLAGEKYCHVFAKTFGLETVALRYFNVYGPRQHPGSAYAAVIPLFIRAAKRGEPLDVHWDGKQARDFTYIDNVVSANLLAAEAKGVSGEAFNIACGSSTSLLQMIRHLEHFCGHPLRRRHIAARQGDVRRTWADIRKAKTLLHYKPLVNFEEGLRRTWEWVSA